MLYFTATILTLVTAFILVSPYRIRSNLHRDVLQHSVTTKTAGLSGQPLGVPAVAALALDRATPWRRRAGRGGSRSTRTTVHSDSVQSERVRGVHCAALPLLLLKPLLHWLVQFCLLSHCVYLAHVTLRIKKDITYVYSSHYIYISFLSDCRERRSQRRGSCTSAVFACWADTFPLSQPVLLCCRAEMVMFVWV